MAFKINVNTNNTGNFGVMPKGNYEMKILKAKLQEYKGNYSISFDVEVRSDVDQKYKGAKVLYNTLYLSSGKPEYEEQTEQRVNSFFHALGCNGEVEIDVDEELKKAVGKNVLCYVGHREKDGKTFPTVISVNKTKYPKAEGLQNASQTQNVTLEVSEEDLPF